PRQVRTRIEAESDVRLMETYESVEIAGYSLKVPAALQRPRMLFITYLDDDVMIARDGAGAPDLLVRK
ncbi:unnamed protein product, partial [Phaeothamnion confervicola]